MGLSPSQQALRRTCVTASDVAAIAGLDPYRRPIDVWTWLVEGYTQPDNEWMRWGRVLEPVIRRDYGQRLGVRVEVPGTLVAEDDARHGATPDGIVYAWGSGNPIHGLEIKVHGGYARAAYGKPGTDDVPMHELIQCTWNLRVTGLPRWVLVVCCDGPPREYLVQRDLGLESELIDVVNEFWIQYVETRTPPPPDGSDAYSDWLKRLRPAADETVIAESELAAEIAELRAATRELAKVEARYRLAVQHVQASLGSATRIDTTEGRLTWRPNKKGTRVFRLPQQWRTHNDD